MKPIASFALLLFASLAPSVALGWGEQGHNAIWILAQSKLTPEAKQKVADILAGDKLALTAVWMDEALSAARTHTGTLANDEEAAQFNSHFSNNASWHFVDLPLKAISYQDGVQFTSSDDVVHALSLAIKALEGTESSLSKRIALRAIVHFVGDIHQPLHCAEG